MIEKWRKKKLLRDYYISYSKKPQGELFIFYFLFFCGASLFIFTRAENFYQVIQGIFLVLLMLVIGNMFIRNLEYKELEKKCRQKISEDEFWRRLEQKNTIDIIKILKGALQEKYSVKILKEYGDTIECIYNDEKTAIIYRFIPYDELLETKDVMYILRDCRQKDIKQVRIFTNGEYSEKAKSLGERYGINTRLYNGKQMKMFLKDTDLIITSEELDVFIKKDMEKKRRKLQIIKNEAISRSKMSMYIIYGIILLVMAWLNIGIVYWNLVFGLILMFMALLSFWITRKRTEEETTF